ncbi:MAG: hypothetical protein JWM99_4240, partial [Verrucomicrobiales bacterium]|nr:hypothetical protein [Verrucomicrobiales bacterium]
CLLGLLAHDSVGAAGSTDSDSTRDDSAKTTKPRRNGTMVPFGAGVTSKLILEMDNRAAQRRFATFTSFGSFLPSTSNSPSFSSLVSRDARKRRRAVALSEPITERRAGWDPDTDWIPGGGPSLATWKDVCGRSQPVTQQNTVVRPVMNPL